MKTVGLIVEYNPLHNGHVFHFQQAKKKTSADAVVAVMSGNFMQRGEPALIDKWARTEMALNMGIDLVIELPIAFATQPAEWFAFGAISALEATGVVDTLCFGSESGELTWLEDLAKVLYDEPSELKVRLQHELETGASYPSAYHRAVHAWMVDHHALWGHSPDWYHQQLKQPNNTLGLHYLIALQRLKSSIRPKTILRQATCYGETKIADQTMASATAIRHQLIVEQTGLSSVQPYMPEYTVSILQRTFSASQAPMHWEQFFPALLHQLLISTTDDLRQYSEVSEGLEFRIKKTLSALPKHKVVSMHRFLKQLKTKRYTWTKLQRTLLRILLQHHKESLSRPILQQGVPYLRVLGMSEIGRLLLRKMRKTAQVPVILNTARHSHPLLEMDIRAAQLFAAAYPQTVAAELTREYTQSPLFFDGNDAK